MYNDNEPGARAILGTIRMTEHTLVMSRKFADECRRGAEGHERQIAESEALIEKLRYSLETLTGDENWTPPVEPAKADVPIPPDA